MARTTKMRLEPKARAFVRHLYRETDGGGRIVCLTDEGRAIVSGVGSDDD
jgi:hypothetical protein